MHDIVLLYANLIMMSLLYFATPETIANAFLKHVINLPKKENIHRHLRLTFKEVPGIVNIIHAVCGNKKTSDPVYKWFSIVDLNTKFYVFLLCLLHCRIHLHNES